MREFGSALGFVFVLAFLLVSCDPQGSGEAVKTFIDAVQGESK